MHRHHLVGCGVGIALALVVVALAGGSAGSIGVLIALLICPLVMIGALMLLTRQRERTDETPDTHHSTLDPRSR
jgi:uncharacterized membrane protein YgaE (UPF0421/DUF939 family)